MPKPTLNTDTSTPLSLYDVSRWRPITPEKYTVELGHLGLTVAPGFAIETVSESLPDGRIRMTTFCEVKPEPFEGITVTEPYLMVLYDIEAGKTACLMRTDADPAYIDG